MSQKMSTCLWFDTQAEEAVNYYASVFKDAKVGNTARYDKESAKVSGRPEGSVLTIEFEIEGMKFLALNGGKIPGFDFTSAISFIINCETQEEIDHYWEKLSSVKESEQCGWCKDKFGITWQVVPTALGEMLSDPNPKKAQATMKVMLEMKKLDLNELKKAYDQA